MARAFFPLVPALLLLAGCCSTFDQDFDAARPGLKSSNGPGAVGMPGAWEGTWTSSGGHEGGLRCIVTTRNDTTVETRYHATYGWFLFWFSFEYSLPVTVERDGAGWKFHGNAVLDSWVGGGPYEYEGRVEGDEFNATYRSEDDHGVFKMKRAWTVPSDPP